jgi:hypothetical protein
VLLDKTLIDQCFDADKALDVGYAHRVHWVLMGTDSRLADCELPSDDVIEYHYAN